MRLQQKFDEHVHLFVIFKEFNFQLLAVSKQYI